MEALLDEAEEAFYVDYLTGRPEGRISVVGDASENQSSQVPFRRGLAVCNPAGQFFALTTEGLVSGFLDHCREEAAKHVDAADHFSNPRPRPGRGAFKTVKLLDELVDVVCGARHVAVSFRSPAGGGTRIYDVQDLAEQLQGPVEPLSVMAWDSLPVRVEFLQHDGQDASVIVLLASGKVLRSNLATTAQEPSTVHDDPGDKAMSIATCGEKRIAVGLESGTVALFSCAGPQGDILLASSKVPAVETGWTASHVLWLSSTELLVTYRNSSKAYVVYNVEKEPVREAVFDLELYNIEERDEFCSFTHALKIPSRPLVVVGGGGATDIEFLVKDAPGGWRYVKLPESSQICLPQDENCNETFPLGLGVDLTDPAPKRLSDELTVQRVPRLLVYSSDGLVLPYAVVDDREPNPDQLVVEALPARLSNKSSDRPADRPTLGSDKAKTLAAAFTGLPEDSEDDSDEGTPSQTSEEESSGGQATLNMPEGLGMKQSEVLSGTDSSSSVAEMRSTFTAAGIALPQNGSIGKRSELPPVQPLEGTPPTAFSHKATPMSFQPAASASGANIASGQALTPLDERKTQSQAGRLTFSADGSDIESKLPSISSTLEKSKSTSTKTHKDSSAFDMPTFLPSFEAPVIHRGAGGPESDLMDLIEMMNQEVRYARDIVDSIDKKSILGEIGPLFGAIQSQTKENTDLLLKSLRQSERDQRDFRHHILDPLQTLDNEVEQLHCLKRTRNQSDQKANGAWIHAEKDLKEKLDAAQGLLRSIDALFDSDTASRKLSEFPGHGTNPQLQVIYTTLSLQGIRIKHLTALVKSYKHDLKRLSASFEKSTITSPASRVTKSRLRLLTTTASRKEATTPESRARPGASPETPVEVASALKRLALSGGRESVVANNISPSESSKGVGYQSQVNSDGRYAIKDSIDVQARSAPRDRPETKGRTSDPGPEKRGTQSEACPSDAWKSSIRGSSEEKSNWLGLTAESKVERTDTSNLRSFSLLDTTGSEQSGAFSTASKPFDNMKLETVADAEHERNSAASKERFDAESSRSKAAASSARFPKSAKLPPTGSESDSTTVKTVQTGLISRADSSAAYPVDSNLPGTLPDPLKSTARQERTLPSVPAAAMKESTPASFPQNYSEKAETTSLPPATSAKHVAKASLPPLGSERNVVKASLPPLGSERNVAKASLPPLGSERNVAKAALPPLGSERNVVKASLPPLGSERNVVQASLPPTGSERDSSKTPAEAIRPQSAGKKSSLPPSGSERDVVKSKPPIADIGTGFAHVSTISGASSQKSVEPSSSLPKGLNFTAANVSNTGSKGEMAAKPLFDFSGTSVEQKKSSNEAQQGNPLSSASGNHQPQGSFSFASHQDTSSSPFGAQTFGQPVTEAKPKSDGKPSSFPATGLGLGNLGKSTSSFGGSLFGDSQQTSGRGATTPSFGSTSSSPFATNSSFGQTSTTTGVSGPANSKGPFGSSPFGESHQSNGQATSNSFGSSGSSPFAANNTFGLSQTTPAQTSTSSGFGAFNSSATHTSPQQPFGTSSSSALFGQSSNLVAPTAAAAATSSTSTGFGSLQPGQGASTFGMPSTFGVTAAAPAISQSSSPFQTASGRSSFGSGMGQQPSASSAFAQVASQPAFGTPSAFGLAQSPPSQTAGATFGAPSSFGAAASATPTSTFGNPPATPSPFGNAGTAFGTQSGTSAFGGSAAFSKRRM